MWAGETSPEGRGLGGEGAVLSEVCVASLSESPPRKPLEPTGASEDEEEAVPLVGRPVVLCGDTGGSPEPVVALKVASL